VKLLYINAGIFLLVALGSQSGYSQQEQSKPSLEQTISWLESHLKDKRKGTVRVGDCRIALEAQAGMRRGRMVYIYFANLSPSRITVFDDSRAGNAAVRIKAGSCATDEGWGRQGCPEELIFGLHGVSDRSRKWKDRFEAAFRRFAELCNDNLADEGLFDG
jgi:hypothetical protein